MNIEKFKNIIKECVREVLKEEMSLISESLNTSTSIPRSHINGNKPEIFLSEGFEKGKSIPTAGPSAIEMMLMETANEMSSIDRKNIN